MSESDPRPLAPRVFASILGMVMATVIAVYLANWLKEDIRLKYYTLGPVLAKTGTMPDGDLKSLAIVVEGIKYDGKKYDSLQVSRFLIVNDDAEYVKSGAEFYFTPEDGKSLPEDAVIDIVFNYATAGQEILDAERIDKSLHGPGFRLKSAMPGHSEIRVSLVLDATVLQPGSSRTIELRKLARGSERLQRITPLSTAMITLKVSSFIVWCLVAAAVYGIAWLLINIYFRNYSSGARLTNKAFKKLFGRGFIHDTDDREAL